MTRSSLWRSVVIVLWFLTVSYGQEGLITKMLGYPPTCQHGRNTFSCTLSIACWMIGGTRQSGCGGSQWLISCCVIKRNQNTAVAMPMSDSALLVESAILRRRVDDVGTLDDRYYQECGVSRDQRSAFRKRIIGGREAIFGQFPWQAHIRIAAYQCGGVLVSRKYVATAAHCIIRARIQDITVYLGELDTQDTGQVLELAPAEKHRVVKKIIHPLFEYRLSQPDRFDIALLKLASGTRQHHAAGHIGPICLPGDEGPEALRLPGRTAVVAGWGKVLPSAEQPGTNVLRSASVPILQTSECLAWHHSKQIRVELYPEMLCAGHADGNQDACLGDSGGPLIIFENGRWTLVGITSAGFGCGEPHQPGIYHNVAVTAPWIRHMINL